VPDAWGATAVTLGQYRAVTGANPSLHKGPDELPVANVSRHDAIAISNALSEKEGPDPCASRASGCKR
jgi:hypothetical protein